MKKVFLLIQLLIVFIQSSNAQWSEQNSGVTANLYSVSAVNNNVVWTCGASGVVLRTSNGGTNWIITSTPNASLDMFNIWGIDETSAIVTASGATTYTYKTTNGGTNWTQVFTQAGGFIDAISMSSVNNGFMVGDPVGGRWSLWIFLRSSRSDQASDSFLFS